MIEIQESNSLSDILNELYSALNKVVEDNKYDLSSNIFHILGIEHREVPISSYLAYLLNPRASHNQGILFLKEFFRQDSDLQEIKKDILNNTEVYTEYVISNNRRIDILLVNPKFVRIIEVKIYAKDQDSQLKDYVEDIREIYTNVKAIYLTLDGAEPSDISRGKLKKGVDYICMSFRDDVMRMLNSYKLDKVAEDGGLNQFYYNFKQFKEDVKFMVGINEDTTNQAISEFIFSNDMNYRLARGIYNYFFNSENYRNYNLNDIVLDELKEMFLAVNNNGDNSNALFTYVDVEDSNNAVFKYNGKVVSNNTEQSEAANPLYFCIGKSQGKSPFCIGLVNVKNSKLKIIENEPLPIEIEDNTCKNKSGFWHCWKYIPSLNVDESHSADPIFEDNNLNESAIKLLRVQNGISEYIKVCLTSINNFLRKLGVSVQELNNDVLSNYSFPEFYK